MPNVQQPPMTAEQLAVLPDDGRRYELVNGERRMMSPAGGEHGRIAMRLGMLLSVHVDQHKLGVVYAAETGFLLARNPDTVRAPDTAFVSALRQSQIDDDTGFVPIPPDLAGEVISPHDSFSRVEEKALAWLDAGTRMVLLVDPGTQTVHVYRAADNIVVLHEDVELDASDVVPGWRVTVGKLFE